MVRGVILGVLDFFRPPDPPMTDFFGPEASMARIEFHMKALHIWRTKVTYTLAAGALFLLVSFFTSLGLVFSKDLPVKVDGAVKNSSLAKSVEEIRVEQQLSKTEQTAMKADISQVKQQLDTMTPVIKEIYKGSIASTICRLLASNLRKEADTEQTKYKSVDGDYYPESRCGGK
jgi:hypothetical protein